MPLLRKEAGGRFGLRIATVGNHQDGNPPRRAYLARAAQEPFLNGSSSVYVEEMYSAWLKDPSSVHKVGQLFDCDLNFY